MKKDLDIKFNPYEELLLDKKLSEKEFDFVHKGFLYNSNFPRFVSFQKLFGWSFTRFDPIYC